MTQGELEKIPQPFVQHMSSLEERIMEDIVRRIKINGFSSASADWELSRIQQLGESEADIKQWIKEALKASDKDMDKIFPDIVYKEYTGKERAYHILKKKQLPFEKNQELQQLINAVRKQTSGEFKNMTASLGFAQLSPSGKIRYSPLQEFYRNTLDAAMMDIASGAFGYDTVLRRTIDTMTKSGVRWIDFDSGHRDRVDVAARRAVMTGFRQIQGKINEQVAHDLHTDSYEVTWHAGARPSHQVWQGCVWTMRQLVDVCGLGDVAGLHGANCYHDYNAFVPGVSARTYTDEQLDRMNREENTPKIYNGKEYSTYEALQQQRKMERVMRKTRQDISLMEKGEADPEQVTLKKARYQGQMQTYKDFSSKAELPEQMKRVYQDGLCRMVSGKEVAKSAKSRYNTDRVQDGKNYAAAIRSEEKKICLDKIETAVLLNDKGDIIFRESSGATNYVQFSKEQLGKMKGAILTHNHPSNSTFSAEDVELMTIHKLKAIRATGKERTFQLLKMNKGDFENGLAADYKMAMANNKKITDAEYTKITKQHDSGNIGHIEYSEKVQGLNATLNQLNSKWLKENSKKYGYRYSVIERRKGNA